MVWLPGLLLGEVTEQNILWSLIICFKDCMGFLFVVTFLDNTTLLLEKNMQWVVSNQVTR